MAYGNRNNEDNEVRRAEPVDQNPESTMLVPMAAAQGKSLLDIAALMTMARRKDFRRDIQLAIKEAEALITLDKVTAESCFYALPARAGGNGKKIMGPSIGMAETLFSVYGNMVVSLDDINEGDKEVTIRGWIIDTQNGSSTQDFVRRNIMNGPSHPKFPGQRYNIDMIATTVAAGRSILFRNLVLRMVPRPIVRKLFEAARNVALGDGKTFEERQKNIVGHWMALGVPKERLLQHLGHVTMDQIAIEDFDYLIGLEQAIKLGDTTVQEAFAVKAAPERAEIDPDGLAPTDAQPGGFEKAQAETSPQPKGRTRGETKGANPESKAPAKESNPPDPEPEGPPFEPDPPSEPRTARRSRRSEPQPNASTDAGW